MFDGLRDKMRARYSLARLRETKFLMSFDLSKLNGKLMILLAVFVGLSFLDILTTLVALNSGPVFVELNPIANRLFQQSFVGFVTALTLKYIPVVPLIYATFARESPERPLAIRIVKVSALIALAAADVFYFAVVGSNVRTLATYYLFAH